MFSVFLIVVCFVFYLLFSPFFVLFVMCSYGLLICYVLFVIVLERGGDSRV